MADTKHLGLVVDTELHDKFYYAAKYHGRSGNKQLIVLIRNFVNEFEKEHGKIELDKK